MNKKEINNFLASKKVDITNRKIVFTSLGAAKAFALELSKAVVDTGGGGFYVSISQDISSYEVYKDNSKDDDMFKTVTESGDIALTFKYYYDQATAKILCKLINKYTKSIVRLL